MGECRVYGENAGLCHPGDRVALFPSSTMDHVKFAFADEPMQPSRERMTRHATLVSRWKT